MNRRDRRAQRAHLRSAAGQHAAAGWRWAQRVDPDDSRWVLIEMRIPNGGMPPASYVGAEAMDRIDRFVSGFAAGQSDAARTLADEDPEDTN